MSFNEGVLIKKDSKLIGNKCNVQILQNVS